MPVTVAVLGTGIMGAPMARNAAAAGLRVRAWNRSIERAEPLAEDGIEVLGNPGEAVQDADIVVTMLADAHATAEVMGRPGSALEAMKEGAVWAQMGTLGLDGAEHAQEIAVRHGGVPVVDAPVVGTRQPAEEGALVVLASGDPGDVERCAPLFDAVGRTVRLGEAGEGTRLKLVANAYLLGVVEALAESVALAEGLGLDPSRLLEALEGGSLDSPLLRAKGQAMIDRDFPTAFPLRHAHKDAELVRAAAARHDLGLPLLALLEDRLARGVHAGYGDEDVAATVLTALGG